MSKISSIGKNIRPYIQKFNGWCEKPYKALANVKIGNYKPMQVVNNNYIQDKTKFITGLGVASIILKDGVGCYMYVTQSLNNKEIPEDKRKFVAALDLANGGLMILTQLGMFFTISNKKVQEKMFNKFFGKYFDRAASKGYQAKLKNNDLLKDMKGADFHPVLNKAKKDVKAAFENVTSLVASSIVAKRMLVPFIATPLADKTGEWMNRHEKPDKVDKGTKNTYNTHRAAIDDKINEGQQTAPNTDNSSGNAINTNLLDKFKKNFKN